MPQVTKPVKAEPGLKVFGVTLELIPDAVLQILGGQLSQSPFQTLFPAILQAEAFGLLTWLQQLQIRELGR